MQQQDQLAIAQGNTALNLIGVYRAMGGGWEIRLPPEGGNVPPSIAAPMPANAPPPVRPEQLPPSAPADGNDTIR